MNRLLGTLFALATLAAIAFAILNYGTYTSICFTPAKPSAPADALDAVDTLDMADLYDAAAPTTDGDIAPVDAQIDASLK